MLQRALCVEDPVPAGKFLLSRTDLWLVVGKACPCWRDWTSLTSSATLLAMTNRV